MKGIAFGLVLLLTTAAQIPAFDEGDVKRLMRTGDCQNCNLKGALLSWSDLRWADLRGSDLSGGNLSKTNLKGANLKGANLKNAIFCRTIMPGGEKNNAGCQESLK